MIDQKKIVAVKKTNILQLIYIALLFAILVISFFTPMKPFDNTDIFGTDTITTKRE